MTDDAWRRRWWFVCAGTLGAALVAGSAVGLVTARRGPSATAGPRPLPSPPASTTAPPALATPSASPTPSAPARPTPTASPTPSPTPSPLRSSAPPVRSATPSATASPSATPTATPPSDMAWVLVQNTFGGTVEVVANGVTWTIGTGGSLTGEVVPSADGNDQVSVRWTDHPECGLADAGNYFEGGRTYRLRIATAKGSCTVGGTTYSSPSFDVRPG